MGLFRLLLALNLIFLLLIPSIIKALELSTWAYRGEWATGSNHHLLREDYILNPKNQLFEFDNQQNNFSLDLETDWFPSENTRFHGRGIAIYQDSTTGIEQNPSLIEGSFQYQALDGLLFLDFGKVLEEWGSGYSFNPVNALLSAKSPDTPLKVREGITLFKMEVFFPMFTFAVIMAGTEDETSVKQEFVLPTSKKRRRFALKLDHVIGETDFSWTHVQGGLNAHEVYNHLNGDPHIPSMMNPINGVSWTKIFGDSLELHGEWALQRGRNRLFPEQISSGQTLPDGTVVIPVMFTYSVDQNKKDRNYSKILLGGHYTFSNDFNVLLEWYHDQSGYNSTEWQKIKTGIQNAHLNDAWINERFSTNEGNIFSVFITRSLLYLQQTGFRKNYAFVRLASGEFGERYESESIFLSNLDDHSSTFLQTFSKREGDNWFLSLSLLKFRGDKYSEYGLTPYESGLEIEATYMF